MVFEPVLDWITVLSNWWKKFNLLPKPLDITKTLVLWL